jgi:hypothetical protein
MDSVVQYLNERFKLHGLGYYLEYVPSIKLSELIGIIKSYDKRVEFSPLTTEGAFMKPDGGMLVLRKKRRPEL